MTKKGRSRTLVSPSAVICRSSMHSSRADWVRGVARFSSSARRMLVKAGPLRKVKIPSFWLYTLVPVMSEGNRSGVNCTRVQRTPRLRARAFAVMVLPVPGTSSSSTWPPAIRAVRSRSRVSPVGMMTFSTFSRMDRASPAISPSFIFLPPENLSKLFGYPPFYANSRKKSMGEAGKVRFP